MAGFRWFPGMATACPRSAEWKRWAPSAAPWAKTWSSTQFEFHVTTARQTTTWEFHVLWCWWFRDPAIIYIYTYTHQKHIFIPNNKAKLFLFVSQVFGRIEILHLSKLQFQFTPAASTSPFEAVAKAYLRSVELPQLGRCFLALKMALQNYRGALLRNICPQKKTLQT